MQLPTKHLSVLFMLLLMMAGCIMDEDPDCPDVQEPVFNIRVSPANVLLPYQAQTPASENLIVTCMDLDGQTVNTPSWTLFITNTANPWLELTLDPAGLTERGTSISGTGSRFIYLVATENTTAGIRTVELSIDGGETVAVTVSQGIMPITISPPTILLEGVPHHPATQTVSVVSNGAWSLTSNREWLQLSLNADGSNASYTVNGNGSQTVYLVVEANDGDIRDAGIYLNDIASDVRVVVTQESLIAEQGEAAPRIFISGSDLDAKLLLTKDPTNYGAYFQFGSIIGWKWDVVTAAFNPTRTPSLSIWNTYWNNEYKDVVHSRAEILLGRGDPCRLVGYKVEVIQTALDAGKTLDNTIWRLPLETENIDFGLPPSEWTTIKGIPGRFFIGTSEFLPAAGRRYPETGDYRQKGIRGSYISSSIDYDSKDPFSLYFDEHNVFTSDFRDWHSQGYSVRCVRQ